MTYTASRASLARGAVPQGTRVCLVISDADARARIATELIGQDFAVSVFADAASFYRAIAACGCELVVIDAALEGENGLSIAAHLRSNPKIGIVVLLASATVEARLKG